MMADKNIVHADPTTVATTHVEVLEVHTEDHQGRWCSLVSTDHGDANTVRATEELMELNIYP